MGTLNNVIPFTLIVFGETRIASGLASILNATTPLLTVIAAHFLTTSERLTWGKPVGVLFGLIGVAVLIGPDALSGLGGGDWIGEVSCLLAAVTYGFAGIYGRRFKGVPPLKVATGQITASTIILLPIAAVVDRPWTLPAPDLYVWAALAGIALLSTALAYMLYFRILATVGATNLLLVTFLLPISALLLGVLALGETITVRALVGMLLIGTGARARNTPRSRRRRMSTPPSSIRSARCGSASPTGPTPSSRAIDTHVLVVDGDHDEAIKRAHTEYISRDDPARRPAHPVEREPFRLPAGPEPIQPRHPPFPWRRMTIEMSRARVLYRREVPEPLDGRKLAGIGGSGQNTGTEILPRFHQHE